MECKKEKGRGERFTNSILIFSSPLGTIHIVEVCVKKNIYELGFSYIIIQNFLRSNLFFLSYFEIENISRLFKKIQVHMYYIFFVDTDTNTFTYNTTPSQPLSCFSADKSWLPFRSITV